MPLDGFSLATQHPMTHAPSPVVHGTFAPETALAQRDIVFSNTAMLSGAVVRQTGAAVTSGSVTVSVVLNGSAIASADIGGDARYRVTGLLPGTYVLKASIPHAPGSALLGIGSVTVHAGDVATSDLTIEATGAIGGTLSTATGTAVPNVVVSLGSSNGTVSREARTDTGGVFCWWMCPKARSRSADGSTTGLRVTVPAVVVRDVTTPVALAFPAVGRLEVQVNSRAAPVRHRLRWSSGSGPRPGFRSIGPPTPAATRRWTVSAQAPSWCARRIRRTRGSSPAFLAR